MALISLEQLPGMADRYEKMWNFECYLNGDFVTSQSSFFNDDVDSLIAGEEVQERSLNRQGVQLGELQMKTPISLHLDHTHSLYVAIGTLVSAVLIVIATVSIHAQSRSFTMAHLS